MALEKSKSEQLEKKMREIAPEKADVVLTRYQKVQEGLHDALFGKEAGDNISAAEAGLKRLEEMEAEILEKGKTVEAPGHKEQRESLVTNFDAELGAIADGLGLDLSNEPKEADVRRVFEQQIQKEILEPLGINVKTEHLVKVYMKRSGDRKASLEVILASFRALEAFGKLVKEPLAKENDFEEDISLALILFVNGHEDLAAAIIDEVAKNFEIQAEAEEVVERLRAEREKLKPLEDAHLQAAEAALEIQKRGKVSVNEADAETLERYATSLKELVGGFEPLVKIGEAFVNKEPAFVEERAAILAGAAADLLNVASYVVQPAEKDGPLVVVGQKMVVPTAAEKFKEMKESVGNALLFVRRNLFLKTRLDKYRPFFDESQEKMTAKLDHDAKEALDEAAKADEKDISGKMLAERNLASYKHLKAEVDDYAASVVLQFDRIQKLQVTNPVKAAEVLADFRVHISRDAAILESFGPFFEKSGTGSAIVTKFNFYDESFDPRRMFFEVGKYPALRATLLVILDNYRGQADLLAVDLVAGDPDLLKFQDDFRRFFNQYGKPFGESVNELMERVKSEEEGGGQEDVEVEDILSETFVEKWLKPEAIETLMANGQVLYAQVDEFLLKIERYYYDPDETVAFPLGVEVGSDVTMIIDNFRQMKKYLHQMNEMCVQLLAIKGAGEGAGDAFLAGIKMLAKIVAAVVAAVAAVALIAKSLGTLTPVAAFIVTTAVSSFGATVGFGLAEGVIEGDWSTLDLRHPQKFLKAWGIGALFCGAGRLLGNVFGVVGGRTAVALSRVSPKLSLAAQDYMKRYAERLMQTAMHGGKVSGVRAFLTEAAKESGEETLEESIQYIAYGLAQTSPEWAFVLSCIPSGTRRARAVFVHKTGGFAPAKGITGFVADNGMVMEYENAADMKAFLEERGAPKGVLDAFNATGVVSGEFNGVAIHIKQTTEPGEVRSLLIRPDGMRLQETLGLRFDQNSKTYVYNDGSPALVDFFERNGFLVEVETDGTLKIKGVDRQEVQIKYKNLEIFSLVGNGLSQSPDGKLSITVDEDVLPVMADMIRMGYDIVEADHGFNAVRPDKPVVEINVDKAVADAAIEGLQADLQLAQALDVDLEADIVGALEGGIDALADLPTLLHVWTSNRIHALRAEVDRRVNQRAEEEMAREMGFDPLTVGAGAVGILGFAPGCSADNAQLALEAGQQLAPGFWATHPELKWMLTGAGILAGVWIYRKIKSPGSHSTDTSGSTGINSIPGVTVDENTPWPDAFNKDIVDGSNISGFLDIFADTDAEIQSEQVGNKRLPVMDRAVKQGLNDFRGKLITFLKVFRFRDVNVARNIFRQAMQLEYIRLRLAHLTSDRVATGKNGHRSEEIKALLAKRQEILSGKVNGVLYENIAVTALSNLRKIRTNEQKDQALHAVDEYLGTLNLNPEEAAAFKKAAEDFIELARKFNLQSSWGKLQALKIRMKFMQKKAEAAKRTIESLGGQFRTEHEAVADANTRAKGQGKKSASKKEIALAGRTAKNISMANLKNRSEIERDIMSNRSRSRAEREGDMLRLRLAEQDIVMAENIRRDYENASKFWTTAGRIVFPGGAMNPTAARNMRIIRGALVAAALATWLLWPKDDKGQAPEAVPGTPEPGTPEAAGAEAAAEGGQQARSSIAIIKAAADAREIVDKKNELREVVEMLRTGKNELGDDMTGPDRERLDKALRDLETRLRELGVPQEKIDGIKNPPKTEEKSSETTTAEKHEEIKFPDITSPKSGFRIHDDDVEYR